MVTVVLTGIPNYIASKTLEVNLKRLFETSKIKIGGFKVRVLKTPYKTFKKVFALDFGNEEDAATAESLLHSYEYEGQCSIHAKITNDLKFMPPRNLNDEMSNTEVHMSDKELEDRINSLRLLAEELISNRKREKANETDRNGSDDNSEIKIKKRKKKKKKRERKLSSSSESELDSEDKPKTSKTKLKQESSCNEYSLTRKSSVHSANTPLNHNEPDSSTKSKGLDKNIEKRRRKSPLSPGEISDEFTDEPSTSERSKNSLRYKKYEHESLSVKEVSSKKSAVAKSPFNESRRSRIDLSIYNGDNRNRNREIGCISYGRYERETTLVRSSPPIRRSSPPTRRSSPPTRRSSPPTRRSSPPIRRSSPPSCRSSPPTRRSSPPIRRSSPPIRRSSPPSCRISPPARRSSPPTRRSSPPIRRSSPPTRRSSPPIRRSSPPTRIISPPIQRSSTPTRRISPPTRRSSPPTRRISPPTRRSSPPTRRISPLTRRSSPPTRRISPPTRRSSPPTRRISPPTRRSSPPTRRISPPTRSRVSPPKRRISPPSRRISPPTRSRGSPPIHRISPPTSRSASPARSRLPVLRSPHSFTRSKEHSPYQTSKYRGINKEKRPSQSEIRRPRFDNVDYKDRSWYKEKEARKYSPFRSRTFSDAHSPRRGYVSKDKLYYEDRMYDLRNVIRNGKGYAYDKKYHNIHSKVATDELIKEILELFESASKDMRMSQVDRDMIKAYLKDDVKIRFKSLKLYPEMTLEEVLALYRSDNSVEDDKTLVDKYLDGIFNFKRKFQESKAATNLNVLPRPYLKTDIDTIWEAVDEAFQELFILRTAIKLNSKLKNTNTDEASHPTSENESYLEEIIAINNSLNIAELAQSVHTKEQQLAISSKLKFAIPCKNIKQKMKTAIRNLNLPEDKRKVFDVVLRRSIRSRLRMILEGKPYMSGGDITKLYREMHPRSGDEDFVKELYGRFANGDFDDFVDSDADDTEPIPNKESAEIDSNLEKVQNDINKVSDVVTVELDESDFEGTRYPYAPTDPILIEVDTEGGKEANEIEEVIESSKKTTELLAATDDKGPAPAKETIDAVTNENKKVKEDNEVNNKNNAATTELELDDADINLSQLNEIEKALKTNLKLNLLSASKQL